MSGKSKKYLFWGKLANMFGVALAIASLVTNLLPAGTVSAHSASISATVACQSDGTKLVTWTISQDMGTGRPMDITAINQTLSGVGVGTIVTTPAQGTQTFEGDNHSSVTLTFTGHWAFDNYLHSFSGSKDLGNNTCAPETPPPPASASVAVGACTYQDGHSSTKVTLTLSHATLTIDGNTYNSSTDIYLSPGNYHYTWTHKTGYTGSGSGDISIGDCAPKASASVSLGACTYHDGESSVDVIIAVDHASLSINHHTYDHNQTISLHPGSYDWTARADHDYVLSEDSSGTLVVNGCPPGNATASATISGSCSWTQGSGSVTPVTIALSHASLTINSVTYTTPQTINLGPGSYHYTWAANESGYIGSGSGDLTIGDCTPGNATGSATISGSCSWTIGGGSVTPVTIALSHTSLTINSVTYTTPQTINLGPGSYHYTWTANESGYVGSGSGDLNIGECTPPDATASVVPGSCQWTPEAGSLTPVSYTLDGASLTITKDGSSDSYGPFTTSGSVNLGPGSYSYSWTALGDHKGSGSGGFTVNNCTPPDATASVIPGSCQWTAGAGSLTPVNYTLDGASLTITKDGSSISYGPFTTSGSIDLGPGSYSYSWSALSDHKGSGSGTFSINDCTAPDAEASIVPGTCGWTVADGSQTPVTYTLTGASLTFTNNGTLTTYGPFTVSGSINLGPGDYSYAWTATTGFKGSGGGSLVIGDCTPGNASASVSTGACSYSKETGASTPVTITLVGASFTINGQTYIVSTDIDLGPGIYPYSWTALPGYINSGSGNLDVGNCNPSDPLVKTANPLTYSTVGAVINYTYIVTNLGNVALTGLKVTDDKTSVSCPKDTLTVNETVTCTASYTILQGDLDAGSVTNHATSFTDQTGPVYAQATVTAVVQTGLTIDKTVTESTYTLVSDILHYHYLVTNTGNVTLTGVSVTDDKTSAACPKTTLAPAEAMTCMGTYSVSNGDMGSEQITNTAYATGLYGTVPVQSAPDSASVKRFLKLNLSGICAANPVANDAWQVVNPNNYTVGFQYSLDGGVAGTGDIGANLTTTFETPVTGRGTGVMSLYAVGNLQNNATVAKGCNNHPPSGPTPQPTLVPLIPVTGAGGPTVLIPVTGVDMGLLGRMFPRTLFGLSFSFFGLGFVLTGLARRHEN
jgi:uncharacterized repeat protein (TIGR01451 family)